MKFALCKCSNCDMEYIITLEKGLPKEELKCLFCSSNNIKYKWIR